MTRPKPAKRPRTAERGLFITLEGGEGAGKSSQVRRLASQLQKLGHEVVVTREPGGSPGAEAVRHVLLSGAAEPFGAEMEAILFAAARADHVSQVIEPALASGKAVISDRFFDSTRVYQGVGGKVDPVLVRQLEQVACGDTRPDITIILDLDPKEGMARAGKRRDAGSAPDRFEKESLKLQEKRRQAFLKIARDEPQRCIVIDGSGTEAEVARAIWSEVRKRLQDRGKAKAEGEESERKTGNGKSRSGSNGGAKAEVKAAPASRKSANATGTSPDRGVDKSGSDADGLPEAGARLGKRTGQGASPRHG